MSCFALHTRGTSEARFSLSTRVGFLVSDCHSHGQDDTKKGERKIKTHRRSFKSRQPKEGDKLQSDDERKEGIQVRDLSLAS